MNIEVFYSKKSDDWKTPSDIYKVFMDKGFIDPCPYKSTFDGLKRNYENQRLFINPPFSDMANWINWSWRQLIQGHNDIVLLIPARTDTKYFHALLSSEPEIIFIQGRLHYNDSEKNAPFPSVIIILNNRNTYKSILRQDLVNYLEKYL